jgi:hypothetical protein
MVVELAAATAASLAPVAARCGAGGVDGDGGSDDDEPPPVTPVTPAAAGAVLARDPLERALDARAFVVAVCVARCGHRAAAAALAETCRAASLG